MAALDAAARSSGLTPEEIIRRAVSADLDRAEQPAVRPVKPRKRKLK